MGFCRRNNDGKKNNFMKKLCALLSIILLRTGFSSFAQIAVIQHNAFQAQEKICYNVYYNVIGIYINAGTATFTTSIEKLRDVDVFHVVGEGSTNSKYDWIFKVRDRYESYFNTADLQP